MSVNATLPETLLIDFSLIELMEQDENPDVVKISAEDGFFLNTTFSNDFRIRRSVYDMLLKAKENLPKDVHFIIYEAYRSLARQKELWQMAEDYVQKEFPNLSDQEKRDLAETFVADPFNEIGSGHQAGCAIDISLCDKNGVAYDMGTACQEISDMSQTLHPELSKEATVNRQILVDALEQVGFINYPAEWWHFSYGDHQWAYLIEETKAFFGPMDI